MFQGWNDLRILQSLNLLVNMDWTWNFEETLSKVPYENCFLSSYHYEGAVLAYDQKL